MSPLPSFPSLFPLIPPTFQSFCFPLYSTPPPIQEFCQGEAIIGLSVLLFFLRRTFPLLYSEFAMDRAIPFRYPFLLLAEVFFLILPNLYLCASPPAAPLAFLFSQTSPLFFPEVFYVSPIRPFNFFTPHIPEPTPPICFFF